MTASPRQWSHMTWTEVRDLPGERTVAILPVGAVEAEADFDENCNGGVADSISHELVRAFLK